MTDQDAVGQDVTGFVEQCGLVLDSVGGTRMSGRLLGWLLVSDPPEQSADDLARALRSSPGGISTVVRQLVAQGLLERTGTAGDRRVYYRLRPQAWATVMRERQAALAAMRQAADDGLDALQDSPPARRERLESMRSFFTFLEHEFPALVDRYAQRDLTGDTGGTRSTGGSRTRTRTSHGTTPGSAPWPASQVRPLPTGGAG